MKIFGEWMQERRKESDKFGKVNFVIFVLGFSAHFLALYLQGPSWIPTAIIWAIMPLSVSLAILQWRKFTAEARAEKIEMQQRWAQEDMELNATVLLPPER